MVSLNQAHRPRVSVVMTVYNQEAYLAEAIDSILSQSLADHELILVDDGSTDGSEAVARSYGDRVRYVRRNNGGLGAARNTGIELAQAEYIAFCDADDVHLPYRLEAHAHLLDQAPNAALVFSELSPWRDGKVLEESLLRTRWLGPLQRSFDEEIAAAFGESKSCRARGVPVPEPLLDRRVHQGRVPGLIALAHVAWGGASMFRRSALRSIGGHDPSLRRYTDWYVVSKLSKSYELIFLDVPVLLYRMHEQQMTKLSKLGAECYRDVILRIWKGDPVMYARHREVIDRALGAAEWQLAHAAQRSGDDAEAERHFRASLLANPRQRRAWVDWMVTAARRTFIRPGPPASG